MFNIGKLAKAYINLYESELNGYIIEMNWWIHLTGEKTRPPFRAPSCPQEMKHALEIRGREGYAEVHRLQEELRLVGQVGQRLVSWVTPPQTT